jgi:cytochrome c553
MLEEIMKNFRIILILVLITATSMSAQTNEPEVSDKSQACITCHENVTPGIISDWLNSRHSKTTVDAALKKDELQRRVSVKQLPDSSLAGISVGCYECHGQNLDAHNDSFNHFGYEINVVVSPNDCATCHPEEREQFAGTKKAHAVDNLRKNSLYHTLVDRSVGSKKFENGKLTHVEATQHAKNETCYACHGTEVTVDGLKTIDSDLGEVEVPNLTNWPNQGVGRINPDGSMGSCSACHARHSFSIEVARKPHTCGQCHLEPDLPAYNVYKESKHGNIYSSTGDEFNWNEVPWTVGEDFNAPTCASCHNSLVTNEQGDVIAERSHNFGSRLWVRIFGTIYSHPQPKSGKTYEIRNKDGLPLPTTFTNEKASEYLISAKEQEARKQIMRDVCTSCHGTNWVNNQFEKIDKTNKEADELVMTSTKLMQQAWNEKVVDQSNPFDEKLEKMWVQQWLFYANSLRYATAMMGPDFSTFKNGLWYLNKNLVEMKELLDQKTTK